MNYTEQREEFRITTNNGNGDVIPGGTLEDYDINRSYESGDSNFISGRKEFEFVVNGKNPAKSELLFEGLQCSGGECAPVEVNDGLVLETETRNWSEASSWPLNKVPEEGDDVEIEATWNMILDVPVTPVLNSLTINGRLTFSDSRNITLNAKSIWVQTGQFYIGSASTPYVHDAKIILQGEQE